MGRDVVSGGMRQGSARRTGGMRKGQASFEFLSTYGWAFVVVLVVMGALAYFGVLRADTLLPEKCVFEEGILCRDFAVVPSGEISYIKARMVNTFGKAIIIEDVSLRCTGITPACPLCPIGGGYCGLGRRLGEASITPWKPEEEREFFVTFMGVVRPSDRPKLRIEIKYNFSDGYFSNNVTGDMFVRP